MRRQERTQRRIHHHVHEMEWSNPFGRCQWRESMGVVELHRVAF